MFTNNPFAELSAFIPPTVTQTYIVVMILMVAGGTLFDTLHKKSATYFFRAWRNSKDKATRQLGGGEMASLAMRTVAIDVLASGEFCNVRRRIAHILTFYGFVAYIITTVIMVFLYPTPATPAPAIVPALWNIGALMVLVGGYWFWFFIRVDVAHEGNSPFRLVRADLFVVSLLLSVTLGLIWEIAQATGAGAWTNLFLALYIFSTTVLFVSIPWSKFSHMFYKPAAAFEKRVVEANGSSNLPAPAENSRGEA
ncbi:MAG: hypothetical protein QGI13_06125 [Rhodospirillales bacterium]|nr:hypothetical protein [Rhodospirillales bacterium]